MAAMFTNYKELYEAEKAKVARLELELKIINDTVKNDTLQRLTDANQKLREMQAVISTMQHVGLKSRLDK